MAVAAGVEHQQRNRRKGHAGLIGADLKLASWVAEVTP